MKLSFRPAVDQDHHRARAGKFRQRSIEKSADGTAVPALPMNQLGLREIRRVQSASLAVRPALRFIGIGIDRIDVPGRPRGTQRETDFVAVLPPAHVFDDATRKRGNRLFDLGGHVVDMQHIKSVLVRNEGDLLAIVGEIELRHIPGDCGTEIGVLAAGQVDIREPMKLGFFVRRGVDAFAIFAEAAARIRDLLPAFGGQQGFFATVGIHQPEITFICRNVFHHQQFAAVGRPVESAPASTFEFCDDAVRLGLRRIHHPEVHVFACAAGRAVRELAALMPPDHPCITRLAVGEQGDLAGIEVIAIKLVELASTHILAEDEIVSLCRLVLRAGDGVGIER